MSNKGYTKLVNDPSFSNDFVQNSFQQQKSILYEQDETLEKVGDSLRTLKDMTSQIGFELGEQSEILDELGSAMSTTDVRLNNVMKKVAKLTHLESDDRQCTVIFVLIGLIVILLFILIV